MRTQRNNKTEMNQRSSFAFWSSFDWSWLMLFLLFFFCFSVFCLLLSLCLSVRFQDLRFRECRFFCVFFFVVFRVLPTNEKSTEGEYTHLNKTERLLVHKEKLRFNRWPLVHFIQLALISHCRCYTNIIFLSLYVTFGTLVRATCFVTFSRLNIKPFLFLVVGRRTVGRCSHRYSEKCRAKTTLFHYICVVGWFVKFGHIFSDNHPLTNTLTGMVCDRAYFVFSNWR